MLIRVKVNAGARKELLVEIAPNKFKVDVKEKAEQNTANKRVVALIARHFHVPEKSVRIMSGHQRSNKTLTVIQ